VRTGVLLCSAHAVPTPIHPPRSSPGGFAHPLTAPHAVVPRAPLPRAPRSRVIVNGPAGVARAFALAAAAAPGQEALAALNRC
ncbi:hypothetical protein, partial [Sphingomonas koreensis]|uniref:hypothetical protein n=1 Tax=Sphingomonas koreensis TaxID=93064 RepID=UPI0019D25EFA